MVPSQGEVWGPLAGLSSSSITAINVHWENVAYPYNRMLFSHKKK